MTRPFLMSGIDSLLEGLDAETLDGLYKGLGGRLPQFKVSGYDLLHHVGDLAVRDGRPEQRAKLRPFIGAAAKGDLVELLAVFLDAQNADMADMMVAAGIDAARNVDVQPAKVASKIEIAEPPGQLLGHRNSAGVGEAAVIEPGAGDDVGDETDIRGRDPDGIERTPQLRKIALRHMGEHQVLLVADPDLAERIAIREIGDRIHLLRRGIAGRSALGLERERHDGITRHFVVGDRIAEPSIEAAVSLAKS